VPKRLITILVLAVFLLQSCTLPFPIGETPTPTPTSTQTATPTPTATPTLTPTPTPVPAARIDQADYLMLAGDYDAALQQYQAAYDNSKEASVQAAALVGVGRVQLIQGSYTAAINTLNDALKRFAKVPESANANYFLAQAYIGMNNQAKAVDAYGSYLKQRPGVLDGYIQEHRGDLLAALNDPKSALAAYAAADKAPQLGDTTSIKLKIGQMYYAMGDTTNALRTYLAVYDATSNEYYKAQANLLAGQVYLKIGKTEQAYARYQDSVNNYQKSYDSYTALVTLVNDGETVNELNRGLVDYYAKQYGYAIEAFNRYLESTPNPDSAAHHYKALSLIALKQPQAAIAEWDAIIQGDSSDSLWATAWDEKAYTQWYYLDKYSDASQTLRQFVDSNPSAPEAPAELFEAARILERDNQLEQAATVWQQVMEKYPSSDWSYRSMLLAGVAYYRLGKFDQALTVFQKVLLLGTTTEEQSSGSFWIGKTQSAQNKQPEARAAFTQAAQTDPTGYYSERARELLDGQQSPMQEKVVLNLDYDLAAERKLAESWMRVTFNLAPSTNLSNLGALADEPRVKRGTAFWELGLYSQARDEFESLRQDIQKDPESSFRLLGLLVKLGFYRSAILTARQVLDLAGLDDAGTLTAPSYFNHIRFGLYFKDYVLATAQTEGINPLYLYSVLRQESLFEGFSTSGAGALGVMQIIPDTGAEVATQLGWPPNYTTDDLFRPMVSIRLGARYLDRQRDAFNGDLFVALAAYNGGPGNAQVWNDLAGGDPDLFLETVRITETRTYVMQIFEFFNIYMRIYQKNQP